MSLITRVSLTAFTFEADNLAASAKAVLLAACFMKKGARAEITKYAICLETRDGCIGEYVLQWGASPSVFGQMQMLAPMLVGRQAEERQGIYDDLKREARQFDHMGHGPLDIALWDWQGRALGCSVATLLGSYRKNYLPMPAPIMVTEMAGWTARKPMAISPLPVQRWAIPALKFMAGMRGMPARKQSW